MAERPGPRSLEADSCNAAILMPRGSASLPPTGRPLDQDDFACEMEQSVSTYIMPPPMFPARDFVGISSDSCRRPRVSPVSDIFSSLPRDVGRFCHQPGESDDRRKSPTSSGSGSPKAEREIVRQTPETSVGRPARVSPSSMSTSLHESLSELTLHTTGGSTPTPIASKDVDKSVPNTTRRGSQDRDKANWALYDLQDENGDTLLHFSLIAHPTKTELIKKLIDRAPHPSCLDVRNFHGLTPVHIAIYNDQPDIVGRLLDAGASLEPVDVLHGDTPALMACRLGRGSCLRVIVEAVKRRVSQMCCDNGWRNVDERTEDQRRKILQTRDKEGLSCVHLASKLPDRTLFFHLIYEYNADINQIELTRGMTLLHQAAYNNDVEFVRVLVNVPHVDIRKLMYDGRTACQLALDRKNNDVAAILRHDMASFVDESDDDDDTTSSDSEMDFDEDA